MPAQSGAESEADPAVEYSNRYDRNLVARSTD
jgi:hypothetical protein